MILGVYVFVMMFRWVSLGIGGSSLLVLSMSRLRCLIDMKWNSCMQGGHEGGVAIFGICNQ
jgi:galactitol-specific phosphotransferase system IIC component